MISKNNQIGRYGRTAKRKRRKPVELTVPESALQKQMNDTLDAYQIKYIRIEDSFWNWLNSAHKRGEVPDSVYYPFCDRFEGMPDNVSLMPIGDMFNLAFAPELKTPRGKLNKSQKKWAKEINVPILRSTEENEKMVVEFVDTVKRINEWLINEKKSV